MAQINLNLDGQRLFATQSVIASDTIDYITVQVKHTTDWDDCSIWAHFENGEEHYAVEVINQRIEADKHLNLCRGVWKVWCVGFAFNGEDIKCRITSTVETIHVQQTGGLDGDPLPEIPPSESEQILGIAISAKEAAQAAKDAADEIPDRINSSLAEAKASGEFDGAAGKDCEDGG